jgi:hypothetical protein
MSFDLSISLMTLSSTWLPLSVVARPCLALAALTPSPAVFLMLMWDPNHTRSSTPAWNLFFLLAYFSAVVNTIRSSCSSSLDLQQGTNTVTQSLSHDHLVSAL